jgi:hypothetical protein
MSSPLRSTLFVSVVVLLVACAGKVGGPVTGAADSHCGADVTATSASSCHPDAGAVATDGGMEAEVIRYNAEADDDDCKYHLKWTSTPITENADVTFTATVTRKTDGQPATGANAMLEIFLSDTHPAPNTNVTTMEMTPGVYTVGPVRFDQAGNWTVKYHLYHDCEDTLDDSPHGHVGFYVEVP